MTLKVTVLGCGTSSGVPRIGNDWGTCDPLEPRNARSRASILVQSPTTSILVDTTPDMRAQLLAAQVERVDAILWTHDHADHCHGIDDVRQLFHNVGAPISGYARRPTLDLLRQRFAYAFDGRQGYPPTIAGRELNDALIIGDIAVACVDQPHGSIFSTGFLFTYTEKSVGYATDFHEITSEMQALYQKADLWIVDALRERPHPTHAHLAQTLAGIDTVKPGRAILTHMDNSMDYRRLSSILPDGVEPGFDGMTVML